MSPFSLNCAIQIRVVRDLDNEKRDDKIAIHYDHDDDSYTVYYLDADSKSGYQCMDMDGDMLDQYLKGMFTLLSLDDKPYANIQFNIPGMPCVIYTAADLGDKKIVDALMTVMPITNGNVY
jgi:hypothetical protein